MSQLKIKNGNNWESIPAGGIGVPSGGTAGQVLQKSSNTDYATEWADLDIGEGETFQEVTGTNFYARYTQIGKVVIVQFEQTATYAGYTGLPLVYSPTGHQFYYGGGSGVARMQTSGSLSPVSAYNDNNTLVVQIGNFSSGTWSGILTYVTS